MWARIPHPGPAEPDAERGEAQRIKLVTELAKASSALFPVRQGRGQAELGRRPHPLRPRRADHRAPHADVEKLIRVLHQLVSAGNTVVLVEHNLDVIAEADWVIDLGPEAATGEARSSPRASEAVAAVNRGSHTARFLADFLKERGSPGSSTFT